MQICQLKTIIAEAWYRKKITKTEITRSLLVRMRGCLPHLYIFELEVEEVVVQLIVAAGKCSATASGLQAEDERSAMRTHIVNNGFLLLLHLG